MNKRRCNFVSRVCFNNFYLGFNRAYLTAGPTNKFEIWYGSMKSLFWQSLLPFFHSISIRFHIKDDLDKNILPHNNQLAENLFEMDDHRKRSQLKSFLDPGGCEKTRHTNPKPKSKTLSNKSVVLHFHPNFNIPTPFLAISSQQICLKGTSFTDHFFAYEAYEYSRGKVFG